MDWLRNCRRSLVAVSLVCLAAIAVILLAGFDSVPWKIRSWPNAAQAKESVRHRRDVFSQIDKASVISKKENPQLDVSSKTQNVAAPVCTTQVQNRFDCWPESNHPQQQDCIQRGCCWDASVPPGDNFTSPACYFADNYDGYKIISLSSVIKGNQLYGYDVQLQRTTSSPYPHDLQGLRLLVFFETETRVRFKIFDPSTMRYEVPMDLPPLFNTPYEKTQYDVEFSYSPFGISISRKFTGEPLFDSRGMAPLIFADQFLQIGTRLASSYLYGLGEHRGPLLQSVDWQKLVFWTRDQYPIENMNLYGSHPFYMNLEPDGNAHGVFLLNSNAMQINTLPYDNLGGLTFLSTGGIFDFFVFMGPTPDNVVQQYTSLIGKPFMPPLWVLGFHMCKHGYGNSSEFYKVIQRNRAARMPYDVQWNDLDYSAGNKDWTWDNVTYVGLPDIINDLHTHGQHNIIIVDPGISSSQPSGTYPPYDLGLQMGLFLKNADGTPLIGKVWPGETAFVDFLHPQVPDYWLQIISQFHSVLPFDGLWIDMNEPSNFVDGSVNGCTNNSLDKPPFVPPGIDGGSLYAYTTCPSAQQNYSSHYNLHNLYGWGEMRVTAEALWKFLGKRTLVLSRSTYPGVGHYGAHWTGDNLSAFIDMYYSIPALLNFNLFGVPLVGADICGFRGNTTRELCIRWMQLGAFYPFMRNHAEGYSVPQDPGVFDSEAQDIMRAVLEMRYSLLPYLYTQFYISHTTGTPVIRPLFFEYPGTESIDRQFLWGRELLISPVLQEGADFVGAYIPHGVWYDLNNLTALNFPGGSLYMLDAPLSKINVHVRGHSIIPMLPPAVTTTLSRQGKMELLVAPDTTSGAAMAAGNLFWDDGESLDSITTGQYTEVYFTLYKTHLQSEVLVNGYGPVMLGKVIVLGTPTSPHNATLNGQAVSYSYDATSQVLTFESLNWDLRASFTLVWS